MFRSPLAYIKNVLPPIRNFSASGDPHTSTTIRNRVANITMCHKQTRNSLSLQMMEDLTTTIGSLGAKPEIRVIVIGAEGPVFSAGHNLKELKEEQEQIRVFKLATKLMNTMIDCPVPIIARVDGLAAAAGCQLVAQCDLAFCTEKSAFSTPGANFGIFCSTPGVALARCVPKTTAMKMLLTGLPISSKEAEDRGLVTKVCTDIDGDIRTVCDAIMTKSRSVIELGKKFYYRQVDNDVKEAYRIGGDVMVANLQSDDGQEGVRSFIEKRKPLWKNI